MRKDAPGDATLPDPPPPRASRAADHAYLPRADPAVFVFGEELARGGHGTIRRARDRRLGRDVAIKELLVGGADARARFEREARVTARLQHPSIVEVLEAGEWPDGTPFIVMKLVPGRTLGQALEPLRTLEERLRLLPSVIAAADALAYAHDKGVAHRDVKPANVLVGEFGETVVVDWGVAKPLRRADAPDDASFAGAGDRTVEGVVIGTPAYMPPEQARGLPIDERADVYALGAMLYHLLGGVAPYAGRTSSDVVAAVIAAPPPPLAARAPDAPPELVAIAELAMAREPASRYPSARELAADLRRFQTGQLVSRYAYSPGALLARWARRHRGALAAAALAVLALGGAGAAAVQRLARARAAADAQRTRAQRSLADANALVDFVTGDLAGRLADAGRGDLTPAIHEAVRRYRAAHPRAPAP